MTEDNTNSERCFELEITKDYTISVKRIKKQEWFDEFYNSGNVRGETFILGTHCLESELEQKKKEIINKAIKGLTTEFNKVTSNITKLIKIMDNGYTSIND